MAAIGKSGLRQFQTRRGLALPAIRSKGGYFASKSPHATAFGDLMLAIFTPIGSRPMNRTFGSGLNSILFEPNLADLASTAEFIVRDAAGEWVPHIVIDRVIVVRDRTALQLKIFFHLVDDETVSDRLVEIATADVVRFLGLQQTV